METFLIFVAIIVAYLLGSIPTSVWIGKIFYGIDIRTEGSGNAGATNTMRVLGWKAGVPVLILDAAKGWLAVYLAHFFHASFLSAESFIIFQIALGIAAVTGHVLPVLAGFRGGKGVATLFGVGLSLYPFAVLIVLAVFIITLIITRFVSLSSITAAVLFPVIEILILGNTEHISLMILAIAVGIFIPVTHRNNLKRLFSGKEKRFRIKKS